MDKPKKPSDQEFDICSLSTIEPTDTGINVKFDKLAPENLSRVKNMVDSCAAGTCNCMTPEVKSKVQGMHLVSEGENLRIEIQGSLTVKEMEETMERSKAQPDKNGTVTGNRCC